MTDFILKEPYPRGHQGLELIAELNIPVGSPVSSIVLANKLSSYEEYIVKFNGVLIASGSLDTWLQIQVNGDTAQNYTNYEVMEGVNVGSAYSPAVAMNNNGSTSLTTGLYAGRTTGTATCDLNSETHIYNTPKDNTLRAGSVKENNIVKDGSNWFKQKTGSIYKFSTPTMVNSLTVMAITSTGLSRTFYGNIRLYKIRKG